MSSTGLHRLLRLSQGHGDMFTTKQIEINGFWKMTITGCKLISVDRPIRCFQIICMFSISLNKNQDFSTLPNFGIYCYG